MPASHWPGPADFQPHITLGLFDRAMEAEQVARIVGHQHLPIRGRVEALALLRRTAGGLETLLAVPLTLSLDTLRERLEEVRRHPQIGRASCRERV